MAARAPHSARGAARIRSRGRRAAWTRVAPFLRVLRVTLLAWGLGHSSISCAPRAARPQLVPEGGYRHLVIALDVSPSMQLKDAGPQRQQTRARARERGHSFDARRAALEQMRVSIVAFYTGAKPAVVDTFDLEVVKNILNDLPLEMAFEVGKTSLIEGIKESAALAPTVAAGQHHATRRQRWRYRSGHRPAGTAALDRAGARPRRRQSRAAARTSTAIFPGRTPRRFANSRRGFAATYHDVNEKHLPSAAARRPRPIVADARCRRAKAGANWRSPPWPLGAALLAGLPIALAFAGTPWQAGVRPQPLLDAERQLSISSNTSRRLNLTANTHV